MEGVKAERAKGKKLCFRKFRFELYRLCGNCAVPFKHADRFNLTGARAVVVMCTSFIYIFLLS